MKIINEVVLQHNKTTEIKHFFNTDQGQLLIIYRHDDADKDKKIETQRKLIESSINIMNYHDQLFAQQFNEKIKKALE